MEGVLAALVRYAAPATTIPMCQSAGKDTNEPESDVLDEAVDTADHVALAAE